MSYIKSDDFEKDVLQWMIDTGRRSTYEQKIAYAASSACDTVIDDAIDGEVSWK